MEMYTDIIINTPERVVVLDLQERLIEMKQGKLREIRNLKERHEILDGTEWEFMADLIL